MANWNLKSPDSTFGLSLEATDNGPVTGTLTYQGKSFSVNGEWVASFSVPGRNYSAFSVAGRTSADAPDWISAAGIMNGSGAHPVQIMIEADVSSSSNGSLINYSGTLNAA